MEIFIGAHPDDIEIGCGAYLIKEKNQGFINFKKFLVLSSGGPFESPFIIEKRIQAFKKNMEYLNISEEKYKIINRNYATRFFDYKSEIKNYLEEFAKEIFKENDYLKVFFHSADNHQDHQIINQLVKEVFRPFLVDKLIEFEIPSSNLYNKPGDNFNIYFDFDENIAKEKQKLLDSYKDISLFKKDDARDINFTIKHNKYLGEKFGGEYMERYHLIFKNENDVI